MKNPNSCDKCKEEVESTDLIWLTADDFRPRKGEKVPEWAFKKYDALCERCYHEILE